MPVPAVIANAAENYRFNSGFLTKTVTDLSPDEWLRRPDGKCNHIAWIVGHVTWARKQLLSRLGTQWSQPWLGMFARGATCDEGAAYPSSDAILDAWREVSDVLANSLATVSDDLLAQPSPQGPPSHDGKVSGVVVFLAIHESHHVGQVSYLRSWLGHKGLMG